LQGLRDQSISDLRVQVKLAKENAELFEERLLFEETVKAVAEVEDAV
jgi:hypothetical protein